ncbi:protein Dr1 homolog isoform X2 [Phragmites australis]|uniref:protein Dr1 homolog isoform X2 n=1 Tax=Phragmites australis TaxID=29695 RepID=UPI002D7846D6|nr:protein Dr1 homolog isoform X2 [Phragmites australis]
MDPMDIVGKSKDDVSLPKSTMFKIIKEMLPADVRVARDAQDLLVECCVEFINLLSSESNEVCSREEKKTIAPEHVLKALSDLGFREYIDEVYAAYEQHKLDTLDSPKAGKFTGIEMTEEEAVAEQQRMFAEARARMNNGAPKPKEPEQEPQQQPQQPLQPQLQPHTQPQQPPQPQLQPQTQPQQPMQPQLQLHPQPQQILPPQLQLHPLQGKPTQPQTQLHLQPQQPPQPPQLQMQPRKPPQLQMQPRKPPQIQMQPQKPPQIQMQPQQPPQVQLQRQLQAQPQPLAQTGHGADS